MVNKAIIIGNLGADPKVEFTPGGQAVCKFPVATSRKWTDGQGQKQEKTTWHNVVVWGKQAETCGQYLAKGRPVFVEGEIDNRTYEKKDGTKGYSSDIIARDVRFLGGGRDDAQHSPHGRGAAVPPGQGGGGDTMADSDDIPFVAPFWSLRGQDVA